VSAQASAAAMKLGEAPVERRERRPVSLHGYAMRKDGSTFEVLLLDLSYDGCGIETSEELVPGEELTLSVLRRGAIEATVRWYSDGRAGLIFPVEESADEEIWPRRFERVGLTAEVSMRRLGKLNYRVQVYDASPEGCKVELVDRPRLEEHVLVKFDGIEALEAEVCWIEGTSAGLRFEKSIHPAVFDLLLERLRQNSR
jgi:hypothetical protein